MSAREKARDAPNETENETVAPDDSCFYDHCSGLFLQDACLVRHRRCLRSQTILKVFSEEFTDKTLNRAIADKELIEYKGDVYVVCKKRKGDASYNGCVDCVRDEGNGRFTVVIAVTMPPSGNKLYVDLPTEKNAAGEFVFSDYPYWERSE